MNAFSKIGEKHSAERCNVIIANVVAPLQVLIYRPQGYKRSGYLQPAIQHTDTWHIYNQHTNTEHFIISIMTQHTVK